MQSFKLTAISAALIASPFTTIQAEEINDASSSQLDPIIITATRTAQTADQSLASVTVIKREEIEQSGAQSVEQLLLGTAGFDYNNNGGLGKQTGFHIRGTNSEHLLVLVDGVKLSSATSGSAALHLFPIDQIERIEIVRGPRSSLYGSEAIGGVIQIFTRQGGDDYRSQASLGYGSNNTYRGSISTSGQMGDTRYAVSVSALDSDGIDARQPVTNWGVTTDQPDEDGYSNNAISLRVGHDFASGLSVDTRLMRSQGESEYDGSPNLTEFVQQTAALDLGYQVNTVWHSRLTLGQSLDESENFTASNAGKAFVSNFDTQSTQTQWQNDLFLSSRQTLTLGIDDTDEEVKSNTLYAKTERGNTGIYAQYQTGLDAHSLLVSARSDDNDAFDRETTGNLAWGYDLNTDVRLTASHGTGYNAPSFNDLYWPGAGNSNLKPETSASSEVGIAYNKGNTLVAMNYYKTDIENLIAWAPDANGNWLPTNINEAQITGLELRVSTELAKWALSGDLSLLSPEDKTTGNTLIRRAKKNAKLSAHRDFGKFGFGGSVIAQGPSFENSANSQVLGGYGTLNLHSSYNINQQWRVFATVDNVGDKATQSAATYNSTGRSGFIGVSYDTL